MTATAPSCPDPGETWALLDVGGHQLMTGPSGMASEGIHIYIHTYIHTNI